MFKSIAVLVVSLPLCVSATTYYLDNGAQGPVFDGSQANPWQTVEQAQTFLHDKTGAGSGDTVLVAQGDSSYGDWVDGAFYKDDFTDLQKQGVTRTDWHVIKALDPQSPPEFRRLHMYVDRDAYLSFEHLKVVSHAPHKYAECVYVRNGVKHLRFRNLEVAATDDSTALPDGFNLNYNTGNPPVDVVIESCYVHNLGAGILGSAEPFTVRYNHIYYLSSSAVKGSGTNHVLVEGNRIHMEDSRITQINLVGPSTGTWAQGDYLTQDVTGAKGHVWRVEADHIKVYPENRLANKFVVGYTVRADSGHASLAMDSTSIHDHDHGSGLSIRNTANFTARNNVIYDFGSSGSIFMYGSNGPYRDMLIENNLVYDPLNRVLVCESLGDNVTIRNNSFMGLINIYPSDSTGGDGSGLYMYNNIAESFLCIDEAMYANVHEGANIFQWVGPSWGKYGVISATSTSIILEEAGYAANYFTDSIFVDYANDDLHLRENSIAIDFGDAANAPVTDFMGFARTATPDAGCFEYDSPYSGVEDVIASTAAMLTIPNPVSVNELRGIEGLRVFSPAGIAVDVNAIPHSGLYLVHVSGTAVRSVIVVK